MTQAKDDIRAFAKRHRDMMEIDPAWTEQAAEIFMDAVKVCEGQIVSVYYPIGKEIDPSPIVEKLWAAGKQVCLPVIQGRAMPLKFAEWTKDTVLKPAAMGILEPETKNFVTPDILIVPLLAFDQQGNRMGYGQGHFDATLEQLRAEKDVLAVGLAYAEQAVLLALPSEPHDHKLDLVVTPQRIFDFRR
ncbi:MAG TPA: 5-formyltetrahydrofolate cyclo-ligase [Alphaproteobacteria bacterium]|nr:5-formyltetrahydrofolate cyclo-ligase [Alphaproteobacteria bacterium]